MPDLTLNENHQYFLDTRPIDGLTSTLKEGGLIRSSDEFYMNRGTAVHLATELFDKGTLDEETVDPRIRGYLESWKRFRKDQNYQPVYIEYEIYHPQLMVASKVDRIPLLDIKTGSPEPWHILQVAFQWETLRIHHNCDWSWTPRDVYLDEHGESPKLRVYSTKEMREAFKVYAAMLYFIRWRKEKYGSAASNNQSRT